MPPDELKLGEPRPSWRAVEAADTLSVVTITRDDLAGLERTGQSFNPGATEWIIVDGSTTQQGRAGVRAMSRRFGGEVLQRGDSGRFDAMNQGLDVAKGEVIVFMNGGDAFRDPSVPGEITSSYKKFAWEWAVGECQAVDSSGRVQWRYPVPKTNSVRLRLGLMSFPHQATAYRREVLQSFGGFSTKSLYADWSLSLALRRMAKPHFEDAVWALFLIGGVSSQQTLHYWAHESHVARTHAGVAIGGSRRVDAWAQAAAVALLQRPRWSGIRADLARTCPCTDSSGATSKRSLVHIPCSK